MGDGVVCRRAAEGRGDTAEGGPDLFVIKAGLLSPAMSGGPWEGATSAVELRDAYMPAGLSTRSAGAPLRTGDGIFLRTAVTAMALGAARLHRCPERAHHRRGACGGCRDHATRRIVGRTRRRTARLASGPRGSCARHAPRPIVAARGTFHSLGRHLCSGPAARSVRRLRPLTNMRPDGSRASIVTA